MSPSEFLWRTLQDYNGQIGALTGRLVLLMSFNTFTLGAAVANWSVVLRGFAPGRAADAVVWLLGVVALSAVGAIALVVRVLQPAVQASPDAGRSLVFFADVMREPSAAAYLERLTAAGEDGLARDLAVQVLVVAALLRRKYAGLRTVTVLTLALQLPAITAIVLLKLTVGAR